MVAVLFYFVSISFCLFVYVLLIFCLSCFVLFFGLFVFLFCFVCFVLFVCLFFLLFETYSFVSAVSTRFWNNSAAELRSTAALSRPSEKKQSHKHKPQGKHTCFQSLDWAFWIYSQQDPSVSPSGANV